MERIRGVPIAAALAVSLAGPGLGGCVLSRPGGDAATGIGAKVVAAPTEADRDCLTRAMYFESNRSDEDGLLAVGTVVMNRLDAPAYPARICDVVGQKRQFAAGVLTRPMREQDRARIERVADALLAGERHAKVGQARHFHVAGRSYPYGNMHYVAMAGGNTFYEKSGRDGALPAPIPRAVVGPGSDAAPIRYASAAGLPARPVLEPARDICRVADEAPA